MKISVIIPTFNEAKCIEKLVLYMQQHGGERLAEIIVIDANSDDFTIDIARKAGALVCTSPQKGRAIQMNHGACLAKGDILYFVHADTLPPSTYAPDIINSIQAGYQVGSYRTKFTSGNLLLRFNAFFSRFNRIMCRGGDQTLYILKPLFKQLNGYNKDYQIMEDYEFILRARKTAGFKVMPKAALISVRKYEQNSYLRVNFTNLTVFTMFFLDCPQLLMVKTYKALMNQDKL
jgi:rSAM/selenodomain-associated transferase 2